MESVIAKNGKLISVILLEGKPTLICSDGTKQVLTKQERVWLHLGLTNPHQLDDRYNMEPRQA